MDSYSLDEAAHLLKPTPDYFSKTLEQLRNMILFAGKTHPILKPCVFFPEPVSMRLAHRNANIYVQESGIEHTMKSVNALPDDPAEAARQKRVNRHWPEDALTPFKYPQVMCQGLFELTFYPEHMDMAEVKESGRIQLYRGKAVRAPLANAAVDRIMNGWYAMSREEVSRAKARTRQEIGDIVILTQGDLHYLVDAPVSIPLSDIRITDKMLTEYAAREGIILPKPHPALPPLTILQPIPNVKTFTQEEVAVILKTDADSVFNRMMGRLGVLLQPSIIIKKPVQMQRTEFVGGNPDDYGRGAEQITVKEGLTGVFGVGGIRPLQWDELGLAQITFGDSSGVLLSQGERSYMVKDPLKIRREDLVVTDVDLLQYGKETIGVTFELPQTEPKQEQAAEITATATQPDSDDPLVLKESAQNASTPQSFDLLEYVKQCKAAKQSNEQICYDLMVDHGQSKKYSKLNSDRLSALAIGIAVFPGQTYSSPKEKDALESKVWKKIASYHKKVTK